MENFKAQFNKVVIDSLSVTAEQITPDARFKEDLGADSLDIVELMMQMETEFKISIPDEVADGIKTVAEAENYILNLLKKESPKLFEC